METHYDTENPGMRNRKQANFVIILLVVTSAFMIASPPLYADNHDRNFAYISRGVFRILGATFQIPRYMLHRTINNPFGLGTIDGVLVGTFYTVTSLTRGALDIGRGAAPYGKYAVFFI